MKCGTAARAVICVEVLECQKVEYYGPDDNDKLLHDIVNWLLNISKSFFFQDIVHGDIKPENLLISGDGGVKICDFGVSRACQVCKNNGSHSFLRNHQKKNLFRCLPEILDWFIK